MTYPLMSLSQCSDVTFSSNQTLNDGITCTDALTATSDLNDAAVKAASEGTSTSSSSTSTSQTGASSSSTSSHHDAALAFRCDPYFAIVSAAMAVLLIASF